MGVSEGYARFGREYAGVGSMLVSDVLVYAGV